MESTAQAPLRYGKDEREKTKEKIRRRNADRRNELICRALRTRPRLKREAHIYRRSTAVLVPRSLSSQGTQHQAFASWDVANRVLLRPLSGRYPPLPVPVQRRTSRSGHNAGEMMPNAARERLAKPRAGTALARAAWVCLPGRVQLGRDSEVYVNETVTNVNENVT